jgi:hypothetical protein
MTKFEELQDIIARKRNQTYNSEVDNNDLELEVAGSEITKKPLISFGDDETDMDLIDQLYLKPKHKPLEGQFADRWDD